MEERLTPKKASAIINILRDKLCKELNPEITEKYI